MTERPTEEPYVGEHVSIQAASRLLDVPSPTIRSWERRYGVPDTPRSSGGHRRFSPEELKALRQMRDEIARGRRAADAAAIVKATSQNPSPQQPLIDDFLQAAYRLEPRNIDALLDHAEKHLGVDNAICDVLLPAMRQIGYWWESGRCDVVHEHVATEAVRAWLNRLLYLGPSPWRPETLILSCGPRDLHTLGLESMGVLLARRGWGCRMLGARTPVRSLAMAVQGTGASGVLLVSHLGSGRRSAIDALRAVQSTRAAVFYAGNTFLAPRSRVGVPGTYLEGTLSDAAATITEILESRRLVT
ncbi:MAG: B12-binding domain-containing protein [Nocardioidaceae bacterium]